MTSGFQGKLGKTKGKNDEYYTPKWLFESLGVEFDLDVAAPLEGVPWLPAKTFYHEQLNGLEQEWYGNVWMNPPYSAPKEWIRKFISHAYGMALLPFSRGMAMGELWETAHGILPMPYNFKFQHKTNGELTIPMHTAIYAFGLENVEALKRSKIGRVR